MRDSRARLPPLNLPLEFRTAQFAPSAESSCKTPGAEETRISQSLARDLFTLYSRPRFVRLARPTRSDRRSYLQTREIALSTSTSPREPPRQRVDTAGEGGGNALAAAERCRIRLSGATADERDEKRATAAKGAEVARGIRRSAVALTCLRAGTCISAGR